MDSDTAIVADIQYMAFSFTKYIFNSLFELRKQIERHKCLDGSGKGTQTDLLCQALRAKGEEPMQITFPDYESDSSALVKMYLSGQFGQKPDDVNAYASSTFYAVDRYASYKKVWGTYYERGGLILTDRYTTSNAVHQTVKCPPQERGEFLRWLDDFEHTKLGLPRPDLVLYLDMPTDQAAALLRRREADTHTQADIHELDTAYLASCRESALQAADLLGWKVIPCVDASGALRPVESIQEEVWSLAAPLL